MSARKPVSVPRYFHGPNKRNGARRIHVEYCEDPHYKTKIQWKPPVRYRLRTHAEVLDWLDARPHRYTMCLCMTFRRTRENVRANDIHAQVLVERERIARMPLMKLLAPPAPPPLLRPREDDNG